MHLINERTREALATDVEMATTRRDRKKGLLGRDGLAPSAAIVLAPCAAVHTAFMRFAIDVLFLDGDGQVLKIERALPPWRIAVSLRARRVVECAAGRAENVLPGDRLYLTPDSGAPLRA